MALRLVGICAAVVATDPAVSFFLFVCRIRHIEDDEARRLPELARRRTSPFRGSIELSYFQPHQDLQELDPRAASPLRETAALAPHFGVGVGT